MLSVRPSTSPIGVRGVADGFQKGEAWGGRVGQGRGRRVGWEREVRRLRSRRTG